MPVAPDYAPSLAASGRRRPPQRATPKNSRLGFFGSPSGRTLGKRRSARRTAPGYRRCGYKTVSGRPEWLNADPIGLAGGLNLYGYVGNNPISYIDPLGLAYLGSRPVISNSAYVGAILVGLDPVHTTIFFEDGNQPSNLSWDNSTGVVQESSSKAGLYDPASFMPQPPAHFDDATMRQAAQNVQNSGNWGPGTVTPNHTCQDFAQAVLDEYLRLMKERNKKKECPP